VVVCVVACVWLCVCGLCVSVWVVCECVGVVFVCEGLCV